MIHPYLLRLLAGGAGSSQDDSTFRSNSVLNFPAVHALTGSEFNYTFTLDASRTPAAEPVVTSNLSANKFTLTLTATPEVAAPAIKWNRKQ